MDEGGQGRQPTTDPYTSVCCFVFPFLVEILLRIFVTILEMFLPHKPDVHAHNHH